MNKTQTSRLTLALTLLLAIVLLFLAFRDANLDEMVATVRQARLDYLAVSCVGVAAAFFLRGLRWNTLLSAEKEIGTMVVFWATVVGYLGNSLLPARAGEIIRTVVIGRSGSISKSFVLATALTERLLDAVALVLISLVAVFFLESIPDWLFTAAQVMGLICLAGVIVLFVMPRFESVIKAVMNRLPLPKSLQAKLVDFAEKFLLGMRAFQHSGRALRFTGFTVLIWLLDGVMTIVVGQALNIDITLPQVMLLLAALGLSSAAPSTPGFVGIYQFVTVTVLASFGISRNDALALIITLQATNYVVLISLGIVGLWQLNVTWHTLRKDIFRQPS